MKWLGRLFVFFSIAFVLSACNTPSKLSWREAMKIKIADYSRYAEQQMRPYFRRAGVKYPPKRLAFLVFKNTEQFEIYASDGHDWRYIRTFSVLAHSGGPGPKLLSGDDQVPEGIYRIIGMNPESHFDLSLHLSYPNAFDRQMARRDNRTDLGGKIYIHGSDRSIGCVAIGNTAIQQVFPLVYYVGIHHVQVIIAPDDLRIYKPIYGRAYPKWLPLKYARIGSALQQFPVP